ncbi:MAG: hypothetical protein FVQ85_13235 [Planctomycetes bacterium]|nr:hypothetical protein [Planctomycetota bacterium]
MNVNKVLTKDYEIRTLGEHGKNEPKTNPIKANTKPIKANKMPKQTQYEPNQTQFQRQKNERAGFNSTDSIGCIPLSSQNPRSNSERFYVRRITEPALRLANIRISEMDANVCNGLSDVAIHKGTRGVEPDTLLAEALASCMFASIAVHAASVLAGHSVLQQPCSR